MFNHRKTTKQLRVIRDCLNGLKTADRAIQDIIIDTYLFEQGCLELPLSEGIDYVSAHLNLFLSFASDYDISGLKTAEIAPVEEMVTPLRGFNFKPYQFDASNNYPYGFKE